MWGFYLFTGTFFMAIFGVLAVMVSIAALGDAEADERENAPETTLPHCA